MVYPAKRHVIKTFEALLHLLPESERTKPQVLLLAGESLGYRHDTDRELLFRQESNFFYLTGCNVPSAFLLASYHPQSDFSADSKAYETTKATLLVPQAELSDMMWSVPPPSISEASQSHDVTQVAYVSTLTEALHNIVKTMPGAVVHTLPHESLLFPKLPTTYGKFLSGSGVVKVTDAYLLNALQQSRLIKDSEEIALIKRANEVSSRAHEVVMRVLGKAVKGKIAYGAPGRPLLPGEWLIEKEAEAEAVFVASCRREGAIHQAYLPIVASSIRASTLHYCCNDKEFAWGPVKPHDHHNGNELACHADSNRPKELQPQVLLIDAGCEWSNYASDITRTMPVGNGGKFTPEAKAIYELVLEMQKQSFAILKPGVHWDTVQLTCHRVLIQGFQRLGIFKSPSPNSGSLTSSDAILASGDSAAFFPHGVGHSLGLDVHDVAAVSKPSSNETIDKLRKTEASVFGHEDCYTYLRLRLPLQTGMVVTVEPGIYFSPHLLAAIRNSEHVNHDILEKYEPVGGVRIEDAVVITETGYENLTSVRSDVEWLEGVCSGEL